MANSDTKTQPWHSDRIVLIQFRGLSATRQLAPIDRINREWTIGNGSLLGSGRSVVGIRLSAELPVSVFRYFLSPTGGRTSDSPRIPFSRNASSWLTLHWRCQSPLQFPPAQRDSGLCFCRENYEIFYRDAVEEIRAWLKGSPLPYVPGPQVLVSANTLPRLARCRYQKVKHPPLRGCGFRHLWKRRQNVSPGEGTHECRKLAGAISG